MIARRLAALLALLSLLVACGDTIHAREYAEPQVARFRELMRAREFEKIYDTSAAEFRAGTARELVVALLSAVDRKLGQLKSAQQTNWNVKTYNGTISAVLTYASKYEMGDAVETFTILINDKKSRLAGYNINSLDMMIK